MMMMIDTSPFETMIMAMTVTGPIADADADGHIVEQDPIEQIVEQRVSRCGFECEMEPCRRDSATPGLSVVHARNSE